MTQLAAGRGLALGGLTLTVPLAVAVLTVLVPVAAVLLGWGERRRARDLARFGEPALLARTAVLPTRGERVASATLVLLALTMLLLALARPEWGTSARTLRGTDEDVLILLDLSRSMNATDVAPSRLDAAKRAAEAIARAVPGARVGLVVFGGSAFLQLPPTLDRSTFTRFLDVASTSEIPDPATNFEAAADLTEALRARAADPAGSAAVLISDGEDVEGKLMKAIETFRRAGVRVCTIGVGTTAGATIPDRDAAGRVIEHRDWAGRTVVTALEEDNLRDIARGTGGVYVRWSGDDSVRPVTVALRRGRGRSRVSRSDAPLTERFQWPLALALVALAADAAVGVRVRRRS